MASLEFTTNLKLIDGSARTTVPTPEELPLGYMCFGIVNSRASIWGNYDGRVHDLVEEGGNLNLVNGIGTGSLVQKTVSSSGTPYANEASGSGSVAFGKDTKSKGNSSFVTGQKNTATENASRGFVGGYDNTIDNATTFAFGQGLKNSRERKATFGQWNKDEYDTLFEVGCGTSDTDRKNAFEVRNNGIVIMQNRAKVYGAPQDPTDVVRKQDLDKPYELIEEITLTEDTAKIDRAGYNLKDVYIYVNAPRYTDTHGITFVVNSSSAISCNDVINKNFNAKSALYASIKGDLLFMGYTQNTNDGSNALHYKQGIPFVNIPRINRLTFQQDVGKVMPAGIVIKIYGR